MKIRPLGDRVVIKRFEAEEKTASGIVIPGKMVEKPQLAEVIEVGPGGMVDGYEVKMGMKVGDKVIFDDSAITEIKLDGETYIILSQRDVLAVVEDCEFRVI